MCGIAGAMIFQSEKADKTVLWNVIDKCKTRGKDSFGIIIWNEFVGWLEYKSFNNDMNGYQNIFESNELKGLSILLHTSRAEPTTEWKKVKTISDIPPFRNDIFAVNHNGIIANDHELTELYNLHRDSSIDTSIMPDLIKNRGLFNSLNDIKGGAAFGIIDTKKKSLILCRNFMPLAIGWIPGMITFVSELSFYSEFDNPFSDWHFWDFPHYTVLELSPDSFKGPYAWNSDLNSLNISTRLYSKFLINDR